MHALRVAMMFAAAPLPAQTPEHPATVVRQAIAAVESDGAAALERRWSRAVARDAGDRAATLGLATLAHLTHRDSLAEHLYRGVLARATTDPIAGYAALGLARLTYDLGRWPATDSLVTIALAAANAPSDAALQGQALLIRARLRLNMVRPAEALATVAHIESLLPPDDLPTRALARCVAASAHELSGDPRAAAAAARAGLELAEQAGDAHALGTCAYALAISQATLFAVDSSLAAYERAAQAFRRARDRAELARVLWWRGDYLRLLGRLGEARRDATEAVREAEAAARPTFAGWARANLARIALAVGDVHGAALETERLTQLMEGETDPRLRATAWAARGSVAMLRGEIALAREAYETSAREANAARWVNGELGARTSLVWVAMQEGDSAAAVRALAIARSMVEGRPGHDDAMSFLEATLALRRGNLADAERLFRRRQSSALSRGARRYVDAARLSEVLVRMGRLEEAERVLTTAADELDRWRASLSDRQLRSLAYQAAPDRADPDLGVATVIASLARAGRIEPAFELVERGRARDLTDRLARATALRESSEELPADGGPFITIAELQRALPDDSTAVLEYVTGRGDPTTLFVITRRGAQAQTLVTQDSLLEPIARFNVLLESGDDPRALGSQLGSALLGAALAGIDPAVRRLVVVPDGPLHLVPLDALVMPDGRFVVERFSVATMPAAAVAARLWQTRSGEPPTGVAVLADPRFHGETEADAGTADMFLSAVTGAGGLPRLRGSAREARSVTRFARDPVVLRRADASEAWLKRSPLSDYGILHFATHALVDEESVTTTALALAPGEGEDGFVGPGELAELKLAAELVVLSACRTAGGVIVRGEGVQGLAAPLLAAGARSVAATWWPVGDEATVGFMDDFYAFMAEGLPAGEALRRAKVAALEEGRPAREWAAFTIVGDPLARPVLQPAMTRAPAALLAAGLATMALLAYGVAMRRRRASEARLPVSSSASTHQR